MTEEISTERALELALAQLDREFGKNTVINLGSQEIEPIPAISTGALNLDLALGIGGLPRGRIVEIVGPESSGKTSLALSVIANAQKSGGRCAIIDTEHALDAAYSQALGIDMNGLLLSQPTTAEEALEVTDRLVGTGALAVIVVDSVAAMSPKAELEGDYDQQHMGLLPRLMSKAMRKLTGKVSNTNTLLIFTNQVREKIGVMYGNPEVNPGGRALKFHASVRLDLRKKEDLKDREGRVSGSRVKVKVLKNKVGPPLRQVEYDLLYGRGINTLGCLVDTAFDTGIFVSKGAWVKYGEETIAQGRDKVVELLASDLDFADRIKEEIRGRASNLF